VAADSLPRGIRSCYQAIYTITNEIADMVEEERGFNPLNHLRNAVRMSSGTLILIPLNLFNLISIPKL
jgi:hypothetical protein